MYFSFPHPVTRADAVALQLRQRSDSCSTGGIPQPPQDDLSMAPTESLP